MTSPIAGYIYSMTIPGGPARTRTSLLDIHPSTRWRPLASLSSLLRHHRPPLPSRPRLSAAEPHSVFASYQHIIFNQSLARFLQPQIQVIFGSIPALQLQRIANKESTAIFESSCALTLVCDRRSPQIELRSKIQVIFALNINQSLQSNAPLSRRIRIQYRRVSIAAVIYSTSVALKTATSYSAQNRRRLGLLSRPTSSIPPDWQGRESYVSVRLADFGLSAVGFTFSRMHRIEVGSTGSCPFSAEVELDVNRAEWTRRGPGRTWGAATEARSRERDAEGGPGRGA
ncbi:hypothetical protein C8R44DRAFT_730486 [Mycena epipterygia]|nr:hypothetical protein C8R44DRAFT_730486 [Mycena epipterygia]